MKITGTFLNSNLGKRVAVLLLIAAATPTLLMTILSSNKVNKIVNNYEQKLLEEEVRNHAISTFTNLTYAKNHLQQITNQFTHSKAGNNSELSELKLPFDAGNNTIPVFTKIIASHSIKNLLALTETTHTETHSALEKIDPKKVNILIDAKAKNIYLARYVTHPKEPYYLLATLSEAFLWGAKENYSADIQLCIYPTEVNQAQAIFCNNTRPASDELSIKSFGSANWELFLNGEFSSDAWLFKIQRIQPVTKNHIKELVGSGEYISIGIVSLLIVGLLSLIQIRRTMVPLEDLLSGTKRIKENDYSPIEVEGGSEFSALANAFNGMSAHIQKQFSTMRSYSKIDREIVSSNEIHQVIQLVLARMQALAPNQLYCIAQIEEQSEHEVQCNCTLLVDDAPLGTRLTIEANQFAIIKQHKPGLFRSISVDNQHAHERLMAEFHAKHLCTLPILWQGDIYGFISIGSKIEFSHQTEYWHEIEELTNRIGVAIASSVREQKLLLEAQYDNLTGLPNRILLQDRIQQAMDHSDNTGKSMWVVFIDLDRFKLINDSMGHGPGDVLLKEIAKRLLEQTRETDTVARFGGDEFVLILSGDAGESIQISVLQRMMDAIAKPVFINHNELVNTCSIGISVYPNDGKDSETLIKNADIAMYRAKELGRNNYQFFTQALNDKAAKRMRMVSLIRRAIEQDEFSLAFQPKVSLTSKKIVGVEALIRWNQPELGYIPPGEFIPIAEEAGLIQQISDWVLNKACLQAAVWYQQGFKTLLVSVNMSAKQFEQDDFIDSLQTALVNTGAKANSLELELTESILMDISDKTIKLLHEIKSLGIELSIDDFGTGYSNLSYIDNLPMQTLKIDKSFIDQITPSTDKAPIVDTVITLGKNMGLKVVAEGVETVNQVNYLTAQDCDQIQGYYFSKPVSADEVTAMLQSNKTL